MELGGDDRKAAPPPRQRMDGGGEVAVADGVERGHLLKDALRRHPLRGTARSSERRAGAAWGPEQVGIRPHPLNKVVGAAGGLVVDVAAAHDGRLVRRAAPGAQHRAVRAYAGRAAASSQGMEAHAAEAQDMFPCSRGIVPSLARTLPRHQLQACVQPHLHLCRQPAAPLALSTCGVNRVETRRDTSRHATFSLTLSRVCET